VSTTVPATVVQSTTVPAASPRRDRVRRVSHSPAKPPSAGSTSSSVRVGLGVLVEGDRREGEDRGVERGAQVGGHEPAAQRTDGPRERLRGGAPLGAVGAQPGEQGLRVARETGEELGGRSVPRAGPAAGGQVVQRGVEVAVRRAVAAGGDGVGEVEALGGGLVGRTGEPLDAAGHLAVEQPVAFG
jgi:hypothetical protein